MIVVEPGFVGVTYPLTNPRIAAYPVSGTVAVSTEADGYPGTDAADGLTWTWWKPTAVPATWTLTFTTAWVSYIGIAAHDLFTVGGTVEVQRWNGSAWVTIISHTPADNGPILFLLNRLQIDRYRLNFTTAIPTVGVIWGGDVLEFPQKARYTGSTSFEIADRDEYRDTVSDGGQVLESFIERKSIPAMMQVVNISETWSDANLKPLRAYAKDFPFFMADRPSKRPNSVVFGRVASPIQPTREIPHSEIAMSVTIEVNAHVGA